MRITSCVNSITIIQYQEITGKQSKKAYSTKSKKMRIRRQILNFTLSVIFIGTLFSCDRKEGDWDDNIKLSTKSVEFSALSDSVTITTGGSWWWVSDVSVNNEWFFDFRDVDLESDHYVIKQDCFVVERRDKNTLFIKVDENPLSVARVITVCLEAGDYFDRVTITQKPRPLQ